MTRGLILGGGGLFGIGWEVGILWGLEAAGVSLKNADLVVGTSAGSVAGSLLLQTESLLQTFDDYQDTASTGREIVVDFDTIAWQKNIASVVSGAKDEQELRRRIGRWAIDAKTISETTRLDAIKSRLISDSWPSSTLAITAIDAFSGDLMVFTAESKVAIALAVAASCAVPGVWPPVTIGSHRYIDGGMRSPINSDLAAGIATVLVLLPNLAGGRAAQAVEKGINDLKMGASDVLVIASDDRSNSTAGDNPLDPTVRGPAALAGFLQGQKAALQVASFWK
ncbi:MAG: patatin-like phospholipase family protein [Acidimicrobiaceae bacterium]|nr:patatin-like phospholipase family protein [Acidimicrobiaceae bacterium]